MLIKRYVIVVIYLAVCKLFAFSENNPRIIVEKFYNYLQTIAEENYPLSGETTEASILAELNSYDLCWTKNINLPNEFQQFNYGDNSAFLAAEVYLPRLREWAVSKHDLKYRPQIINIEAYEEIKAAKNENSTNFFKVYVKKVISTGGVFKEYLDTVIVCNDVGQLEKSIKEGKIIKITNVTSGKVNDESVRSLRGRAAELFSQKKYQEAYDTYLKVIKKDYKQGDAYYRLGLMAYHNLGCKDRFRNKSARLKQAYDYINLAKEHGNYEIKKYARRVIYYMENGSV